MADMTKEYAADLAAFAADQSYFPKFAGSYDRFLMWRVARALEALVAEDQAIIASQTPPNALGEPPKYRYTAIPDEE